MSTSAHDEQEADKYREFARGEAKTLTRFVDWLQSQGMAICVDNGDDMGRGGREWVQQPDRYEDLFARFADIDLAAVERHRRALLADMESSHG